MWTSKLLGLNLKKEGKVVDVQSERKKANYTKDNVIYGKSE